MIVSSRARCLSWLSSGESPCDCHRVMRFPMWVKITYKTASDRERGREELSSVYHRNMSPNKLRTSRSTIYSMCSTLPLLHWGPNFRYMNPWGHIWTCSDHSSWQFGVPNFLGRTIGTKPSLFPPFWYAHDHWFFFLWPFPSLIPIFSHLPKTLAVSNSTLWENIYQDNDKDRVLSFIWGGVFRDCCVFT